MRIRVQKWDNSVVLPIPKSFAEQAALRVGSVVSVSLVGGKLVIQSATLEVPTLEDLLRGVTEANLHAEWDTGSARGREAW